MDGPFPIILGGLVIGAYLLGSVPAGFLLARSQGIDIRTRGSGNIGATNVGRVMGRRWGIACFAIDFLKGLIPSIVAAAVLTGEAGAGLTPNARTGAWLCVAVAAILGHVFPVWLKFKGGKGVATAFGALLGVYPVFTIASLIALVSWIACLKLSRMVGFSSVVAGLVLAGLVVLGAVSAAADRALFAWAPGGAAGGATLVHAAFACVLAALVTFKHRGNIARMLQGTEPRIGSSRPAGS